MMHRVPEKELMNEEEQAKAYASADFDAAHNLFVEIFQQKFTDINVNFNDVVLDLGCGPCDVTRRLAKAYPDTSFHAVDGAATMLKYGAKLNERADLTQRIKLIESSLPQVDLPQPYYHAIISNSLLHHLHNPLDLWSCIQKHAKPFAYVFVMDFFRPVDEQSIKFLSNEYASNEPEVLKNDFENSLRAAFTMNEVKKQLDDIGLTNLKVEEASDRHMIIYGRV